MESAISKNLDSGETRSFDKGTLSVVEVGSTTISRANLEPGWKWSDCIKPTVGTDSCEVAHRGYVISGHLHVRMDDGTDSEIGPGDAYSIEPGHDAWVVGDEAYVAVDFSPGMAKYARS
jgi:hypothetical protein